MSNKAAQAYSLCKLGLPVVEQGSFDIYTEVEAEAEEHNSLYFR